MKKLIAVVVLLLLLFSVSADQVIEFTEGDDINLRPVASDGDQDSLTYFFDPPLARDGTLKTTYGDAGVYHSKVSVSDGRLVVSENITLIINKKEEPPTIETLTPTDAELYIREHQNVFFNVKASDANRDNLAIVWLLDGEKAGEGNYFTFTTDFYSQGAHKVDVKVSDGTSLASFTWNVEVEDVDR